MKKLLAALILGVSLLAGCSSDGGFQTITAQEAKTMMDEETSYVLLDVRSEQEYVQQRIPGAILIPDTQIKDRAESEIPDKATVILVYCRSGVRAKGASQTLADLGYTHVYDMGGILDWPYETISG